VTPEQQLDVSRIAKTLELHAEFERACMRLESARPTGRPAGRRGGQRSSRSSNPRRR
jgi:hypothetical protein